MTLNIELYFTRLQLAEYVGFLVNVSNVLETVQRVHGVLVNDAKATYDSMYGAFGCLAREEKRTAIEMLGIQKTMRRQHVLLRWCHGEANLSDGLTKETVKAQLGRFYRDGCVWSLVHDEEMVKAWKRRKRGMPPLDEGAMGLERDVTDQGERNYDESEYERAFANDSLPELIESRQRAFLESVRLRRAFAISWRIYRTSQYSELLDVVGQALFL